MTRTMESLARVARWPYAGLPPKSTNSLITSSMSARDPSGLPNGPTESSRRRLLGIFPPTRIVARGREREPAKHLQTGQDRQLPLSPAGRPVAGTALAYLRGGP